ncbi:class I SAM-dependent methyltransferase [Alteribacillus sp. HJP-4]|uniref:class I SAM-dependent methyltransferase n=1 Tax=Alteribacillus sp. HJP-4 TaxID=2775394 RepID=UPI0035CCFD25
MKAWYEEHFQEDYLRVYDHRDEEKAAAELAPIMEYVEIRRNMKAVDLCCGNGRHARWLARKGIHVTGVDLSAALLKKAIDLTSGLPVNYMRGDIRDIPLLQEYDLAFNLFTSFGYFQDDAENELVLTRANEALKPGGIFIFDYLNPLYVEKHLVPEDSRKTDGLIVRQKRSIHAGYVHKKILIQDGNSEREYTERVKLYHQDQLEKMLLRNQLTTLHRFGDYNAAPYSRETSPRQLFICEKQSGKGHA